MVMDMDVSRKGLKGARLVGCDEQEEKKTELPLDIVFEFLTRFPLKKIFRCKCVSKAWRSIIEHPSFVQTYRHRQPLCLLSSIPVRTEGWKRVGQRFYYSSFGLQQQEPSPSVNLFNICLSDKERFRVTQVVNGLFCCFHCNQLFLRNVFTGESMRLPLPDVPADILPEFHFGFDPVNGVYKLLSLTHLTGGSNNFQCHILILGLGGNKTNNLWRRLPNFNFTNSLWFSTGSVFVNGALYWKSDIRLSFSEIPVDCFNLTDEKFSSFEIHLPELSSRNYFVQFRGRFSILSCIRERLILCRIGDDGKSLERTWREAVLPGECWHHHPIDLPTGFWHTVVPVGNLPTGELLLMNEIFLKDPEIDNPVTPIYSYDDRNNSFKRFVVGKLPPGSLFLSHKAFAVMEQNIETLGAILRRGR